MKRVVSPSERPPPRVPKGGSTELLGRAPFASGQFLVEAGGASIAATCLNCPDEPCLKFGHMEAPWEGQQVCPTNAMHFDTAHTELLVDDTCFGCGLCVLRCPFDSLYLGGDDRPHLGEAAADAYVEVTEGDFTERFERRLTVTCDERHVADEPGVARLLSSVQRTQWSELYPFVVNALTALGLATRVTPAGDTSNRMDAVVVKAGDSMPVEIKSPTETLSIDVKSVQQALENKVIISSRHQQSLPSARETSSLVVGFSYPSERSDVLELVEDIHGTYGVRIGLLDCESLYYEGNVNANHYAHDPPG